jgi:PTS system fructose-specific IIC component
MDPAFVEELEKAKTPEDFLSVIDRAESDKEKEKDKKPSVLPDVIGVTACPTGIAHTYMAAEALEKAGEKLGVTIKIETRGSEGPRNLLTDEEIRHAKGVIIAADTKVPMERFDGKPLIEVKVADGIHKPEELINKAKEGNAPIFKAVGEDAETKEGKNGAGHIFYTHLMSGVSHMLPFVIGGGIMTALAFLVDTLAGYGGAGQVFGQATPLAAFFKYIGGLAMGLMVPVLAGYIAYSIADRPGLAVGFTGGLIASSGNALASGYKWGNVKGFQAFIANFGFQGANSGNTVSGFLGGILVGFLAGYIVLWLKHITRKMPKSLDGIRPILIYPLCGIFITSILMCFIFNPLIGLVNTGLSAMLTALADTGMIAVLGLILGAMMAIDMGGPINKAAYLFGTAMLGTASEMLKNGSNMSDPKVQACYIAMAAVMVGGMVPPLGIALACRFFPKKFTKAEQETWITNIIMGCSFITEGAIPFAASDPLHVIPATLCGAGVAGFLSALFGCTLMAPHGGVFVFITVGKPLLYIVAWLIGSFVTMFLLALLKKDARE